MAVSNGLERKWGQGETKNEMIGEHLLHQKTDRKDELQAYPRSLKPGWWENVRTHTHTLARNNQKLGS